MLGEGAFGTAYLALDDSNQAAVKVMHDLSEDCADSFDTEIKSGQAGLNHPNVLRIIGAGRNELRLDGVD